MKNLLFLFVIITLNGCTQTGENESSKSIIQKSNVIRASEVKNSDTSSPKEQIEKQISAEMNTIIWEGDSRVDENMNLEPPSLLAELHNCSYIYPANTSKNSSIQNSTCKIVNIGQSGDTAQAIKASELAQGDAYAQGTTIYILDAGGNDTSISGKDAAAIFADLQYIERAQTAKGYTVYIATIADGNVTSAARTKLPLINKLIRANCQADRIIDFARDPKLNNFKNKTYFRHDGIHYTDAGKKLRAATAYARIKEVSKKKEPK